MSAVLKRLVVSAINELNKLAFAPKKVCATFCETLSTVKVSCYGNKCEKIFAIPL